MTWLRQLSTFASRYAVNMAKKITFWYANDVARVFEYLIKRIFYILGEGWDIIGF